MASLIKYNKEEKEMKDFSSLYEISYDPENVKKQKEGYIYG